MNNKVKIAIIEPRHVGLLLQLGGKKYDDVDLISMLQD